MSAFLLVVFLANRVTKMSHRNEQVPILVNTEYCYDVEDIAKILQQRVSEERLRNTFPIDPIFHREKQLIGHLEKEKIDHSQSTNRTVLIPYLVVSYDDGNWIGILVEFSDNSVQRVEYFDSASKSMSKQLLQKLNFGLKEVYGKDITPEVKFSPVGCCEAFSYGPYMIESLVNAAKGNYTNKFSSPFETRLHHIRLMNSTTPELNFYEKQKTNNDFEHLERMKKAAETALNDYEHLSAHLIEISKLVDNIRRDETNCKIIRNVHGYRNPTAKNQKNVNGAKLNFELLSYLKNLNKKGEFEMQLRQMNLFKEPIQASLKQLIAKIEYILPKSSASLSAPDADLGLLEKIISYYHDLDSLEKLLLRLKRIDEPLYASMDPANAIDRYALGYFFVELGEIAHDITDFVQPENESKKNLLRNFFKKFYALRNVPKNKPKKVRTACQNLFQMKFVIQAINGDLKKILQHMLKHLELKLKNIECANSNFHEFESTDSELSQFETEHQKLIEGLTKILQIKDSNLNDAEAMKTFNDEFCECDGVKNVLDKVKNNFPSQSPNPNAPHETHDKSMRKFIEIIDEIRFLQKLLAKQTSQQNEAKLSQAAKMSLSFVVDTFKKFDECQLNNPMLLDDFTTTKKVRNNQIMHKIIYSKLNLDGALALIRDRIAPWLSNFIALFVFKYQTFFEKNIERIDSYYDYLHTLLKYHDHNKGIFTYDLVSQSFNTNANKSSKRSLLWFYVIAIAAYNRLGFHHDILKFYEEKIESKFENELAIDEAAILMTIEFEVAETYMLVVIRKFVEAARLYRNALEKSRRITPDQYENIYDFQRRIQMRLEIALASSDASDASDASKCFALLDKGSLIDTIMVFKCCEHLFAQKFKSRYHQFQKDFCELVLLPHIRTVLIEHQRHILFPLLACYLNEFDVKSFESCLKLQHESFQSVVLKYDVNELSFYIHKNELFFKASYDIILALCKSTRNERNEQLTRLHSHLSAIAKMENHRGIVWLSPIFVGILLVQPITEIDYLRGLFKKNFKLNVFAPYRKKVKLNIKLQIQLLKNVLHQKLHPAKKHDEKVKHSYELVNMKRLLVNTYQKWALKEYLKGSSKCSEFARKILRRAFLFEASVVYLEFKWTHEPDQLRKIGINGINEENDIIEYIRHRFTSNHTSNFDTLMKQYAHYDEFKRHAISFLNLKEIRQMTVDESDDEYHDFYFGLSSLSFDQN